MYVIYTVIDMSMYCGIYIAGIAGVYHIGEHYDHESMRGVEEISNMTRAMYGPDCFQRFSPTVIAANLPALPGFVSYLLARIQGWTGRRSRDG